MEVVITEWLLDLLDSAVAWVVGFLPAGGFPPDEWVSSIVGGASYFWSGAGPLSVWVPWTFLIGGLMTAWFVRMGMATVSLVLKVYAMIRGGAT